MLHRLKRICFVVLCCYVQENSGGLRQHHFLKRGYIRNTPDSYEYEPYLSMGQQTSDRVDPGVNPYHRKMDMTTEGGDMSPVFAGPIKNVTVNVGREAVLSCKVTNLRQFKVGWLKAGDQTILALHKRVITHNSRIQVSHEDNKIWRLHIRNVEEGDRGCYMCQINTVIMKQEHGCIDVNVSPDIDTTQTSADMSVQENHNTSLVCHASGHPEPRIIWRREDQKPIFLDSNETEHRGKVLSLNKVGRKQMGAYLCIATNDVPPAVSKRMTLSVNFEPEVYVPNQLIGITLGDSVELICRVEAFPSTINFWMREVGPNEEMLMSNSKHSVEDYTDHSGYKIRMELIIRNLTATDLGIYICKSTNSLGTAEGTIRIYENPPIQKHIKTTTTTTTSTSPEIYIVELDEEKEKRTRSRTTSNDRENPWRHHEKKPWTDERESGIFSSPGGKYSGSCLVVLGTVIVLRSFL